MRHNRILAAGILLLVSIPAWAVKQLVPLSELHPTEQQQQTAGVIVKVIDQYHYKDVVLDDKLSAEILKRYFDALDPNRSFFLANDIRRFSVYQDKLDDYLNNARIEPGFEIFRTYRQRVAEAIAHAQKLLDGAFDFTVDETYQFEREDEPWPQTRAELNDLWRKRVKNDFLTLKLIGKTEEDIRKTLHARYARLESRVEQFDANDVFQTFINAYTLSLEPHTSYMSPSTSENFDITMSLSLQGIGAVLKEEDGYTVIQETVVGGPAELSKLVRVGDRITGVGQGLEGEIVDVVGWRLQDVVEQIRGPKGSVVRLAILPKGSKTEGEPRTITLVRNKIKLEERAAKDYVIDGLKGMGKYKVGVIEIPTFYRDFAAESRGDGDFRSTTRDVRKLLTELKQKGVDGIVIDLRENGGGSLSEATELTGLFIETGPVVQIKDNFGKVEVERDPDSEIAYNGPLAVLVDRNSASASEIFAGAIQDYKRGLIIGEPTFGKGTVQTLVDLGRFVPGRKQDLGRLRLTMAQFFRVNGDSTQHRGVVPDILFPTASFSDDYGERSLDNALPWAHIKPADYRVFGSGAASRLLESHLSRISDDPGFEMLVDREKSLEDMDQLSEVSLLESARRAEFDKREQERLLHKNRFRVSQGMDLIKLEQDDPQAGEEDDGKESEATHRIELNEAARILVDSIRLQAPVAVMR